MKLAAKTVLQTNHRVSFSNNGRLLRFHKNLGMPKAFFLFATGLRRRFVSSAFNDKKTIPTIAEKLRNNRSEIF